MPETTPEPLIRIYNKRAHSIDGGPNAKVGPASFATVPESVAKAWMKQWPEGVVTAADAQRQVTGATAEANEAKAKLAEAEKRIADLESKLGKPNSKRVTELENALADAQAKISELEEKLTKPQTEASVV